MKYIAFTTKGLEQICAEEIKQIADDVIIDETNTKRIVFETASRPEVLTQLKTVDDVGVFVGKIESSDLETVCNYAKTLDFEHPGNDFSITTSMAGVQGYKSPELIEKLSEIFSESLGMEFSENVRTGFDIRVFIDRKETYFSVRLAEDRLHNRRYKTESKEGSLKPTIAAAMIRLINGQGGGLKLVDNFCGSGTILAESLIMGNEIFGGDIDPESVKFTRNNLSNLGQNPGNNIRVHDATHTNWPDHCFDCAVSNFPWGKQVEIKSITDLYAGALKEYKRIIKPDGKLCLIVSNPELLIKHAKLNFPNANIRKIPIGYLGQNPTIIVIN